VRKRAAYWLLERRNLTGAAMLHATSSAEARSLQRWVAGIPVAILPNGVEVRPEELPARGAFRRSLEIPEDASLIVFVGRLHPIKRLDLLAAAFDRIRINRPKTHLVIAGPDEGGHRSRLEPLFAGAGRAVHWTGELNEAAKWELLANADALVMCSQSESFGRSVLEALAAGVPVVVTRTCPWQQVEITGSGFWVPQTVEAIADALLELLGDRARARTMGERGRALARSTYSWDAIARTMAMHYQAVADAWPRSVSIA
jgi:glycosyltransferase involved in cell wall biosynthesis